jgi:hypothetical protein
MYLSGTNTGTIFLLLQQSTATKNQVIRFSASVASVTSAGCSGGSGSETGARAGCGVGSVLGTDSGAFGTDSLLNIVGFPFIDWTFGAYGYRNSVAFGKT